jgi:hypothetical protein
VTGNGAAISALHLHEGRLRLGYGDFGDNVPYNVHVYALDLADLASGLIDEAALTTEQIFHFVPSSVGLLCPYADPKEGPSNPDHDAWAVRELDGTWANHPLTPDAIHVFGMAETTQGLWAWGSSQEGGDTFGQVWRSTDDGVTWTSSLQRPAAENDSTRVLAGCVLGDSLVVFVAALDGFETWAFVESEWVDLHRAIFVSDAVAWTVDDVPVAFCAYSGQFVSLPGQEAAASTAAASWAAQDATLHSFCVSADGTRLVVLASDARLLLHDGDNWSTLMSLDLDGLPLSQLTMIAFDGDHLYAGTLTGTVIRIAIPA